MLASPEQSTNNGDPLATESSPINSGRFAIPFGNLLTQSRNTRSPDGYVEFGSVEPDRSGRSLGTFAGVFSPVALSMFSALLFIRVGFLVGNAGLLGTLFQFVIAYSILLFTVSSVCAISTNGAVEGGGVYFMISRTLGPEFGGSIGTIFFLANIVGCGLAVTGCAEGLLHIFGSGGLLATESFYLLDTAYWRFFYCSCIVVGLLLVCLVGASLFAKTSAMILGIVATCLLSTILSFLISGPKLIAIPEENHLVQNVTNPAFGVYSGLSSQTFHDNLNANYTKDYSSNDRDVTFAITFGVLFSGVTGIMAGANMSGELKNPSKSIPWGTLSAVLFTFCCYIVLSVLMSATTTGYLLQNNFLVLMPVNIWPPFIAIGILTATFSTALSNLIGASRVLEALAKDQVYGRFLHFITRGTWNGNPIAAVFLSFVLVEGILLIGSLNTIAQINSVLFMLSYLATNLACLAIEITGAPNFRPTFKYFSWHTCFIGLIGTLVMMFVINPLYASSSIVLCLLLVIALYIFSPASQTAQWGSISQALIFHQTRKYLLRLDARKDHVKYWRPQMLLLVASPRSCCPLIHFVNDLKKGGLYVIGHVKVGDFASNDAEEIVDPTVHELVHWLGLIDHMKVKAFAELTLAKTIREGAQQLIRISGMGAMKPNTIILGFYDDEVLYDFFEGDNSPYQTQQFDENNIKLFKFRDHGDEKRLQASEYVGIIDDALRMRKNVCLCRHFHRLDKNMIARNNHIKYIDVWPINIFDPSNEDPFNVVSLFMLQLACIINMLPVWKKLELRVFLCESNRSSSVTHFDSTHPDYPAKVKLEKLLEKLRISASIHEVTDWNRNDDFVRHSTILKQFTSSADPELDLATDENLNRSRMYMQTANQIIRDKSNATAVTFIYLAAPPKTSHPNFHALSKVYLELLNEMTTELPPTILVHGMHAVTSTTL